MEYHYGEEKTVFPSKTQSYLDVSTTVFSSLAQNSAIPL